MGGVIRRRREKRVERRAGMSELRHCVQLSHNHKKRESERKEGGGREDCWEVEAFSKGGVTQASTGEQKLFHVWIETAQLIYYSRILLKNRLETLTY